MMARSRRKNRTRAARHRDPAVTIRKFFHLPNEAEFEPIDERVFGQLTASYIDWLDHQVDHFMSDEQGEVPVAHRAVAMWIASSVVQTKLSRFMQEMGEGPALFTKMRGTADRIARGMPWGQIS